jgi:hypothetical protein
MYRECYAKFPTHNGATSCPPHPFMILGCAPRLTSVFLCLPLCSYELTNLNCAEPFTLVYNAKNNANFANAPPTSLIQDYYKVITRNQKTSRYYTR